jgi:hypothetical protein
LNYHGLKAVDSRFSDQCRRYSRSYPISPGVTSRRSGDTVCSDDRAAFHPRPKGRGLPGGHDKCHGEWHGIMIQNQAPFEIQYRPNRLKENGKTGAQPIIFKMADTENPGMIRIIVMHKKDYNENLPRCESRKEFVPEKRMKTGKITPAETKTVQPKASAFEGTPRDWNDISECHETDDPMDPNYCKVIATGNYGVGGTLPSGNYSNKNPFTLVFKSPETVNGRSGKFILSHFIESPVGKVSSIKPISCDAFKYLPKVN